MEEQKSVKLEMSVADLKRSINELRDEIVRAKSENRDYSKTVSELRGKQAELDEVMKLGKEDVKAYNAEMRAAQKELKGYESQMLKVEKYSDKWYELAKAAGELKDNIQDAKDATKAFASDTRGLDNIVGIGKGAVAVFGTWQGVMGMLGVENDKVVETIQKLQAATTTLTMVQQLQNSLMNKSVGLGWLWNKALIAVGATEKTTANATTGLAAAQKLNETATKGATIATNGFKKALAGIGIGIVLAALAALIANFDKLTKALGFTKKAQDELHAASIQGQKDAQDEIVKLNLVYNKTQDVTLKMNDRLDAVKELQEQYPSYFGNLTQEEILVGNASSAYQQLVQDIMAVAMAKAYEEKIAEKAKENVDLLDKQAEAQKKVNKETEKAKKWADNPSNAFGSPLKNGLSDAQEELDEINQQIAENDAAMERYQQKIFGYGDAIKRFAENARNANGNKSSGSTSGHTSTSTKTNDPFAAQKSAAAEDEQLYKEDWQNRRNKAQDDYLKGLLTEQEYKKQLLDADKQLEADYGNLAFKYKDVAELRVKYYAEADKLCQENEEKSIELGIETKKKAYKEANEAIKKDNEATLEEIELETKQKQLAAYEAFNERTAGMDQNSKEYQDAERDLQKKLGQIDAEERARQIEAIQTYWDKLIALAVENGEETVELERKRQLALTNVFLEGQQQRTKAEKANNKKWKKWSEQTAEERVKTVQYWANSSAELLGYVGEIIEANIQRKVDEGKIDQEEAEKQFERTKALQYSIVWINTLTGMMGAWEKWFDPQTRTDAWTALAMAIATSTAIFAQGVAQSMQIKNMKFGGGGDSGGATGGAGGTVAVQDVQVAPLLNQRQDSQDMTALNTAQLIEQNTEQRVYILQSDLEKSSSQVEARVSQTSF